MLAAFCQGALPLDLLQQTSLYNYITDFLMTIFHLFFVLCCLLWNVYLHVCVCSEGLGEDWLYVSQPRNPLEIYEYEYE